MSLVRLVLLEAVAAPLVRAAVALLLVLQLLVLGDSVLCVQLAAVVLVHGVFGLQVAQQFLAAVGLEDRQVLGKAGVQAGGGNVGTKDAGGS